MLRVACSRMHMRHAPTAICATGDTTEASSQCIRLPRWMRITTRRTSPATGMGIGLRRGPPERCPVCRGIHKYGIALPEMVNTNGNCRLRQNGTSWAPAPAAQSPARIRLIGCELEYATSRRVAESVSSEHLCSIARNIPDTSKAP